MNEKNSTERSNYRAKQLEAPLTIMNCFNKNIKKSLLVLLL